MKPAAGPAGRRKAQWSTVEEIKVAVCSACHPVFTGKRGTRVSEAGRVEKFQKKYAGTRFGKAPEAEEEEKKD